MSKNNLLSTHLSKSDPFENFIIGGLFLDPIDIPNSFVSFIASKSCSNSSSLCCSFKGGFGVKRKKRFNGEFLSVSLSLNKSEGGCVGDSGEVLGQNGDKSLVVSEKEQQEEGREKGLGALNTTYHLCSGAVAAMVSRFFHPFLFI